MIYGDVADARDAWIANLEAQVAALIARIAEQEARLAQNSSNSNDEEGRPPAGPAADNAVTTAGNARCCRRRT